MTTFKTSNINVDAPKWWDRLEMALITLIIPGFSAMIVALPWADSKKVWYVAGSSFLAAIIKGVGIMLGQEPEKKDQ